jgi:hypothetical protein
LLLKRKKDNEMEKKEFKIMNAASALKGSTKVQGKQQSRKEEIEKNKAEGELKEIANFCKGRLREVAQQNIDKAITAGYDFTNICYRVNTYYNDVDAVKKVYKENFTDYLEELGYEIDDLSIMYDSEYSLITFKLHFSWGKDSEEEVESEDYEDFCKKLDKLVEDAAANILAELLGI